jgi:DNA anti-recombination protein RmuC
MMESLSLEQKKKIDLIAETLQDLTKQFRELTDTYRETILKETQSMKSFMEQALADVKREVETAIRRMKTSEELRFHEVEVPASIKQSIVRKSLDSPDCLIHAILHREATPSEIIYALASIRERQRLRGRLHD